MNILDPKKARRLYWLFSYGHGVRESARLVGCNRKTAARYREEWLRVRPELQRAYDAIWDHESDLCDQISATLPDDPVIAMFDAWMDDSDPKQAIKSGFHDGY